MRGLGRSFYGEVNPTFFIKIVFLDEFDLSYQPELQSAGLDTHQVDNKCITELFEGIAELTLVESECVFFG